MKAITHRPADVVAKARWLIESRCEFLLFTCRGEYVLDVESVDLWCDIPARAEEILLLDDEATHVSVVIVALTPPAAQVGRPVPRPHWLLRLLAWMFARTD